MKQKDYIEIEVAVGYDYFYVKETEFGEHRGREVIETIRIPIKDAKTMIEHQIINKLDYKDACAFAKKYNKKNG